MLELAAQLAARGARRAARARDSRSKETSPSAVVALASQKSAAAALRRTAGRRAPRAARGDARRPAATNTRTRTRRGIAARRALRRRAGRPPVRAMRRRPCARAANSSRRSRGTASAWSGARRTTSTGTAACAAFEAHSVLRRTSSRSCEWCARASTRRESGVSAARRFCTACDRQGRPMVDAAHRPRESTAAIRRTVRLLRRRRRRPESVHRRLCIRAGGAGGADGADGRDAAGRGDGPGGAEPLARPARARQRSASSCASRSSITGDAGAPAELRQRADRIRRHCGESCDGWLDPATADAARALRRRESRAGLLEHIALDQLPREYGGTSDVGSCRATARAARGWSPTAKYQPRNL